MRYGILRDGIPRTPSSTVPIRYWKIYGGTVRYGIEFERGGRRYETVRFFSNTVSLWSTASPFVNLSRWFLWFLLVLLTRKKRAEGKVRDRKNSMWSFVLNQSSGARATSIAAFVVQRFATCVRKRTVILVHDQRLNESERSIADLYGAREREKVLLTIFSSFAGGFRRKIIIGA